VEYCRETVMGYGTDDRALKNKMKTKKGNMKMYAG
jgi:hypothetical protein